MASIFSAKSDSDAPRASRMVSPLPCGNRTPPTTGACIDSYSWRVLPLRLAATLRARHRDDRTHRPHRRADRDGHRRHRPPPGRPRKPPPAGAAPPAAAAAATATAAVVTATAATGTTGATAGAAHRRDAAAGAGTRPTWAAAGQPGERRPDAGAYCPATCRDAAHPAAGRRDRAGDLADAESAGRPAAPRRTGCCRRAAVRAAGLGAPGQGLDVGQGVAPGVGSRARARRRAPLAGGAGCCRRGGRGHRLAGAGRARAARACGAGACSGAAFVAAAAATLAAEPLPAALTFSAAGFAPPNDSRSRRATGASTVEDADLTNSPCSLSRARTSLLVTPSSLANSCTRALPATTSPVWRRQRW